MNLQSIVVVILRLVSLNFFLTVALRVAPQIILYSGLSHNVAPPELDRILAMPWLMLTGLVGVAIVIWMCALPIARAVTRDVPTDISLGALSPIDCYAIIFIGVGLVYIGNHFPAVLNWAYYLIKAAAAHSTDDWKQNVKWYEVLQAIIPFFVGIFLFVNARKWAIALGRRSIEREEPPELPGEEQGSVK